ncbi:predicted protein [Phaeodactylum tricornutum CCAP 1055/1]|jgi:vacuolar-type H+-ATPase subunit H|uniref:Transmembrane protein n=1 Tax=Phaeodactylum tricornutum (strain CCAP 1055/1) TaxID=556484 RepID=B5Y5P6_PHATC|nr:predicted protein [Phaeodactylum tricornutum CCAP 1055/1]ACI65695.1 predicted protein [Phaeodactylum tricornutum CCAP 1055/1]|eukprot:XP_002186225.1 predicted protein [Phaeodactylum tricornutum CCAP 1055/1]
MGNNTSNGDQIDQSLSRPRSSSVTRRIVKASKPVADINVEFTNINEEIDEKDQLQEPKNRRSQHIPNPIAESSSVARELEHEKLEHIKQETIRTATTRQRAKREKVMHDRRKNPTKDNKSSVKANPFSRFLTVFSVEPQHPEHKRGFSKCENDDIHEPFEKRLRASDSEKVELERDAHDLDDNSNSAWWSSSLAFSAVAVAGAAYALVLIVRLNRMKH